MDKKRLFRELAVLDDIGIRLFERCGVSPVIFDDSDDREILLYLCEQQIAEKDCADGFGIKEEYNTLYKNEIKGEDFEEYRKRASWVWKCKKWCDRMYEYYPKATLLKLVNKKMHMSETEMTEIFRKFPYASYNDREYGDWIIPMSYESDYDRIMSNIEAQKEATFYIPTVAEIEELFRREYLFSKKSCQNLYSFLLEHTGDETEAKETCFDIWFNLSINEPFDDIINDVIKCYPILKSRKLQLLNLVTRFYENQNNSEFNGYSIAYARRKGIKGKGKHAARIGFME